MSSNRNNTMFSSLLPYPLFEPSVFVVSDSEYGRYIQKQAREEILVLQSKRNRYTAAIADIDEDCLTRTNSHTLCHSVGGFNDGVQLQNDHAKHPDQVPDQQA